MIILPIMIGYNSVEYGDTFFGTMFKGNNTDFGSTWYAEVGFQIVLVMIIFALQPFIDLMVESTILNINRWYYRKYVFKTNIVNGVEERTPMCQLEFLDLYAGPEYLFFYKVANVNLMVFITLIFGSVFPCLYFIALCSIGT